VAPRILTTHVGSLPRPDDLLALYVDGAPADEIAARLVTATAEIVARQIETGLDIVNDGEFGKSSWSAYIMSRITGFEIRPEAMRPLLWLGNDRIRFKEYLEESFPRAKTGSATEACVGPITYKDRQTIQRDATNLTNALQRAGVTEGFPRNATTSSRSPTRSTRSIRPSMTLDCWYKSTTPCSPTCTTSS
jgi:5-methyltetrahydropteroyltriglutamate--homocysteine methyltransferase